MHNQRFCWGMSKKTLFYFNVTSSIKNDYVNNNLQNLFVVILTYLDSQVNT